MKRIAILVPLALASCGTLPQPFYGDPGLEGARLAVPPAPVLVVKVPDEALLADESAKLYANDLAAALVAMDVPSVVRPAQKTDWRITTTAQLAGNSVTPRYAITGPDGKSYGSQAGGKVDAAGWANGDATTLNNAAVADAAPLAKLLAAVNASIQQSNPNSLENRPPRLYFAGVTGAPGDGDNSLALNMNRDLPGFGINMVTDKTQADYTLTGVVATQPDSNNQILVQINWILHDGNNREIGQVTQLHDLNPADITPYWGDVAAAAATEAANGVHEAIVNDTLKKAAKGS